MLNRSFPHFVMHGIVVVFRVIVPILNTDIPMVRKYPKIN